MSAQLICEVDVLGRSFRRGCVTRICDSSRLCHNAQGDSETNRNQPSLNDVDEGTFRLSSITRNGRRHGQTNIRLEARTQGRGDHQPHAQRRRGSLASHLWLLRRGRKNRPPNVRKMCARLSPVFSAPFFLSTPFI